MVFRPYPGRLESVNICRCHYKAALSSRLFNDPECWSGRGLNPRPSARQTGALPTELTRRCNHITIVAILQMPGQEEVI